MTRHLIVALLLLLLLMLLLFSLSSFLALFQLFVPCNLRGEYEYLMPMSLSLPLPISCLLHLAAT